MKTVLEQATRDELVSRIKTLNNNNTAQWGKMNVYQMLKHCTLAEEMYLGNKIYKRFWLGWLIGKIVLKNSLKDETPMGKNAPTHAAFVVKETTGNVLAERDKWISLIEAYANFSTPGLVHWFFGEMTTEQIGKFAYKHADHHLRQFNA